MAMQELIIDTDEVEALVEAKQLLVMGDRVAIVADQKPETFGNTEIIRLKDRTARPLMGTVVALGNDMRPLAAEQLIHGTRVVFNRVGATCDVFEFEEGFAELYIMSTKDIYLCWEEDE